MAACAAAAASTGSDLAPVAACSLRWAAASRVGTQTTSWPASSRPSARRRANPRPCSMAQVTGVPSVIDRIHLSSAVIRSASFSTVNGLLMRLPSASTATATWTCLCGSIPTVTIEMSSSSAAVDDGTEARALAEGQTYCELTAQQASMKSLPARALALRAAVDISTESLPARVLRVTQRPNQSPSRRSSPSTATLHQ
jgi:hypothetical protein